MSRTSRLRRTTLNTATLQEVALHRVGSSATGAVANPYLPCDTPKAIKDAMVLYYDIAKQKATNESMAANPTLKDLSGNGNDATCYNFGWRGMSGIGGYSIDFNDWSVNKSVQVEKNSTYFKLIDNTNNINSWILFLSATNGVPSFSVRITNLIGNLRFKRYDGGTKTEIHIDGDGIFKLEEIEPTNAPMGFLGEVENGLTIELIPLYPNALVSDGVDDYAFVQDKYDDEGNLINKKSLVLNREDGYTVIAKRKWLDENLTCGLISKLDDGNNTNGAFGFELSNVNYTKFIINWGSPNYITLEKNDITYGTSTKYNSININSDDNQIETDYISLFKYAEDKRLKFYGQFALYSIILFDRDLTDEEIQWVKNNPI